MRAIVVLVLLVTVARADDDPGKSPKGDKPWAQGVPADKRAKADAIFAEANDLFAEQKHDAAIAKYQEALALWDHPAIHFNLAVALDATGRVLEAADELDRALKFGDAPFPKETYQLALGYKDLFAASVGTIDAACTQAGTHVSLDGKPWFDCPGTKQQRVLAGTHAIGGLQPGYLGSSQQIFVGGGKTATARVQLVSLDDAVKLDYPYPRYLGWSIAGAGAAVALGGLGVWAVGRAQLDTFEKDLHTECPAGCNLAMHPSLADEKSGARLKSGIGIAMMAVGGAGVATGIVMAILDKPRRVFPVEVAPTPGGVMAYCRWPL